MSVSLIATYNTIVSATLPSGVIIPYAGSTIPSSWLLCDGTSYSTSTYSSLYSIIGFTYGGSGGSFQVPNFTGRIACCFNGSDGNFNTLNGTGGQAAVTLAAGDLPSHTHSVNDQGHQHGYQGQHSHVIYSQLQQQVVQNDQGHIQCTVSGPGDSYQQCQGSGNPQQTSTAYQGAQSGCSLQQSQVNVQFDQGQFQGGGSHSNLQPYNTMYFIIKT